MLRSMFLVGAGSFLGGALRYLISMLLKSACGTLFPLGTFVVNSLGCLLLGFVLGLFGKYNATSSSWCLFLSVGFCGGFTTFSTFANESLRILQNGFLSLVSYVAASIVAGVLMVALGYWIAK